MHPIFQTVAVSLPVAAVTYVTPDERRWSVEHVSGGGLRLYEILPSGEALEHDAVDGIWNAGDLVDYLRAVGAATRRRGRITYTPPDDEEVREGQRERDEDDAAAAARIARKVRPEVPR